MGLKSVLGAGIAVLFLGAVAWNSYKQDNDDSFLKNLGKELRQGTSDLGEGLGGDVSEEEVRKGTADIKEWFTSRGRGVWNGLTGGETEQSDVQKYGYRGGITTHPPRHPQVPSGDCNPVTDDSCRKYDLNMKTWQYESKRLPKKCRDIEKGLPVACAPADPGI